MADTRPAQDLPESMDADPGIETRASATPSDGHELGGPDLHRPAPPSSTARQSRLKGFLGILGPGLVTGVADDDPSGIATYSQAGAALGMGLLWTAPVTLPLMYSVQEVCDRTALVTGDSLGTLVRRRFGATARWVIGVLVVALIVANCLNVAADLAAIGSGMELLGLGPDHA